MVWADVESNVVTGEAKFRHYGPYDHLPLKDSAVLCCFKTVVCIHFSGRAAKPQTICPLFGRLSPTHNLEQQFYEWRKNFCRDEFVLD